mmetsp:Transcript_31042/g.41017  ORF Transcript_31042/g.41017 Transcript_31042/m.41017 type:complete len:296 (-) Transcript_31042:330-1217(-)
MAENEANDVVPNINAENSSETPDLASRRSSRSRSVSNVSVGRSLKKVGLGGTRSHDTRRSSFTAKPEEAKDNKVIDAAMSGDLEKLKKYLSYDYDIKKPDKYGRTILIYASLKGKYNVVKFLLNEKQMDPNEKDKKRRTPLHWLATSGNPEIKVIELMCKHGVNLNLQDEDGCTPLMIACQKITTERMIRTLMQYGANKDLKVPEDVPEDPDSDTPPLNGKNAVEIAQITCGPTWATKVERLLRTQKKYDVTNERRTADGSPWEGAEDDDEPDIPATAVGQKGKKAGAKSKCTIS